MIYHLTTQQAWQDARAHDNYAPESLTSEGFIHASTVAQILPVANAFYRDVHDPVLLCIDETKLTTDLKWEAPAPPDGSQPASTSERFPHIYGALNLDAVLKVLPIEKGADGAYYLPASLETA